MNQYNMLSNNVPFGGKKQSGIGTTLGLKSTSLLTVFILRSRTRQSSIGGIHVRQRFANLMISSKDATNEGHSKPQPCTGISEGSSSGPYKSVVDSTFTDILVSGFKYHRYRHSTEY